MVISLLLGLIYLAFISLGLPDPMLGAAWPVMYPELGAALSYAGLISLIICAGTVLSSLLSERLTARLGTGLVTAISVAMTALALLGFSRAPDFLTLCLLAVPYGLGAGGVDAALNNYVSLHYSSRDMSFLHAFWGLGTMISPYIMSFCLSAGMNWRRGYLYVFILQAVLSAVLFLSLPMWKKAELFFTEKSYGPLCPPVREDTDADGNPLPPVEKPRALLGLAGALRVPGVPFVLLAFFCYCSFETTAGLWASSYLVEGRGIKAETAAAFASLYYIGITAGRFVNGLAVNRLGDRRTVRIGVLIMLLGTGLMLLGRFASVLALAGLVVCGLGCAPVFPSMIHATPANFGAARSQGIIGVQMASAYIGSALVPPLFGLLAQRIDVRLYPFFLLLAALLLLAATELLNRKIAYIKD